MFFFFRDYKLVLIQILSMNQNLPRHWLKLSGTYRPADPSKAYLSILHAKTFSSSPQLLGIAEQHLAEFGSEFPEFSYKSKHVDEKTSGSLETEQVSEEFTDLG